MKEHKALKRIIVILLICVVLFFIKRGGVAAISNLFDKSKPLTDMTDTSFVDYEKKLASENSDLEGLTKLEKRDMGLNPQDGSDTDGDGLTDKEEIEVYHSDPLKRSTSGDLYNDAYKIEHDMDVNKTYEYDGNVEFKYNQCPEVVLTATVEDDLWAVCEPWVIERLNGYKVLGNYNVYNYAGVLSIDISKYLSDDISIKDIVILKSDWVGSDLKKVKTKTKDNIITLKDEIERGDNVAIIVAKKENLIESIKNQTNDNGYNLANFSTGADGFVYSWISISGFWGKKPTILYAPSGDEEIDRKNKEHLVYAARFVFSPNGNGDTSITESDIEIVTPFELKTRRTLVEGVPWSKEITELHQLSLFPTLYINLSIMTGLNESGKSEDHFNLDDELPFPNFGSYISPGGNCAGISHLTALLHNAGYNPPSGTYTGVYPGTNEEMNISWDILKDNDPANVTLTDPKLQDYKNREFYWKHTNFDDDSYLLEIGLSSAEEEFVKMVGAYWAESNNRRNEEGLEYRSNGETNYSWNLIEDMKTVLDHNKILDVGFNYTSYDEQGNMQIGGHRVNITSYKVSPNNPDLVIFNIYDSNFPGNYAGKSVWENNKIDNKLYVQRVHSSYDNEDSFEYYYRPLDSDDCYCFTSSDPYYRMTVCDENWNFIKYED